MTADPGDVVAVPAPTGSSDPVRLAALRLALAHSGAATAALIDMSAALTDAGAAGAAWATDHLTDRVAAAAGEVALLLSTTEQDHTERATGPDQTGG